MTHSAGYSKAWPGAAIAIIAAMSLLAGCGLKLPGAGQPSQLYVLTPKSTFPDDLRRADWQLLVEQTASPAGLDTPRIAVAYSPIELDYFARSNWTDLAPQMVQRLIIESFENSNRIVGVGRDSIGLRSNFLLKTELREFQAEYKKGQIEGRNGDKAMLATGDPPVIRVRINAKLVKMPERIIVASKTFETTVSAKRNKMPAIVRGFDDALGSTIKKLVIWTLREGNAIMKKQRG